MGPREPFPFPFAAPRPPADFPFAAAFSLALFCG